MLMTIGINLPQQVVDSSTIVTFMTG